ncbi:MAG TPA: hypothetical protein VM778_01935 [Gemmatimonadota bacterium]|nr:hypothetical protein [Gemmatimonadota bacterium]
MAPRTSIPLATALLAAALAAGPVRPAAAQDVRPLSPVLEPVGRGPDAPPRAAADSVYLPLPTVPRAEAEHRARSRSTVYPAAWTDLASAYDPHWLAPLPGGARPASFGLGRWAGWFAGAGLAPAMDPHPFFAPWGLYAYEGRLLDLYRSAWSGPSIPAPERPNRAAAEAIRLGDGAMAADDPHAAAEHYARAARAAPQLPHGYMGRAAALAELGDPAGAARALRQGIDRYPAWLALDVDWDALLGAERLAEAGVRLAGDRGADAVLVAGALDLFGGRPAEGRARLAGLAGEPHADRLVARGPRP